MTICTFELCQKILEICNFWLNPWSYTLWNMYFFVFFLEVKHIFEVCTFPWSYVFLRFNFITNLMQFKLEQCNICWDTYVTKAQNMWKIFPLLLSKNKQTETTSQFVYFLREVCLLLNFWMIKFTIMLKKHNCKFYHSKIEK